MTEIVENGKFGIMTKYFHKTKSLLKCSCSLIFIFATNCQSSNFFSGKFGISPSYFWASSNKKTRGIVKSFNKK